MSDRLAIQQALEDAIAADFDDLGSHKAYADFLMDQDDPRGEFIQVQLALEDPARPARDRKELQKREAALLKKHGREWLGELAPYLLDQRGKSQRPYELSEDHQFQFARGWLDTIQISYLPVTKQRAQPVFGGFDQRSHVLDLHGLTHLTRLEPEI